SNILSFASIQFSNAGTYNITVSNSAGTVGSDAVVTVNPPPLCAPDPSGLVSWWQGHNNAEDSFNTNKGTLLGGVSFTIGLVGRAFVLHGNDVIRVSDSPNLRFTNAITLETWVYPTGFTSPANEVLSKWDAGSGADRSYTFTCLPDGRLQFSLSPDGSQPSA